MSLKHAILGFLSQQPLSGYDLKKAFDRSVRHFWPANQSQIYRTLAELEGQGLVGKKVIEREERLDMKVYSITETGRVELQRWLSTPLPEQDYREPFLIQLYFGSVLPDEVVLGLVKREIKAIQDRLAAYITIYRMNAEKMATHPNPRALFLGLLTLEYGISSNQAALEWLESAEHRLRTGDFALIEYQTPSSDKI